MLNAWSSIKNIKGNQLLELLFEILDELVLFGDLGAVMVLVGRRLGVGADGACARAAAAAALLALRTPNRLTLVHTTQIAITRHAIHTTSGSGSSFLTVSGFSSTSSFVVAPVRAPTSSNSLRTYIKMTYHY